MKRHLREHTRDEWLSAWRAARIRRSVNVEPDPKLPALLWVACMRLSSRDRADYLNDPPGMRLIAKQIIDEILAENEQAHD